MVCTGLIYYKKKRCTSCGGLDSTDCFTRSVGSLSPVPAKLPALPGDEVGEVRPGPCYRCFGFVTW